MSDEEMCCKCDTPTGRAGRADDSLFLDEAGPFCEQCYDMLHADRLAAERARFEEWMRARLGSVVFELFLGKGRDDVTGRYACYYLDSRWEAWLAALGLDP